MLGAIKGFCILDYFIMYMLIRVDLDGSRSSVRSRRKRERPPTRRTETGTEVLYANTNVSASVQPAFQRRESNVSNSNTTKRKKRRNVAKMVLAEIRYLQRTTDPLLRYVFCQTV